jgi:hypothetical protein
MARPMPSPRPRPLNRHAALAIALVATTSLLVGACGEDEANVQQPAPPKSAFPDPRGRSLDALLAEAAGEGAVVSPAGKVWRKGPNRFAFGVFTVDRDQINDAQVALYAAPPGEPAKGPFTARIEDLTTEPAFRAKTTVDDPDAAQVTYLTEIDFDRNGEWRLIALVRDGDSLRASRLPSVVVGQYDEVPARGDKAPAIHTPTADEVGGNLEKIDTRVPPSTMHDQDFADVVGRKPAVLLFATPALCQSRVCGPVVDVAEQVKRDYGDRAAFIHMEIYRDNRKDAGVRPQVRAFNLPSEPWLFVIDRRGVIRTSVEGGFSVDELERAVREVTS